MFNPFKLKYIVILLIIIIIALVVGLVIVSKNKNSEEESFSKKTSSGLSDKTPGLGGLGGQGGQGGQGNGGTGGGGIVPTDKMQLCDEEESGDNRDMCYFVVALWYNSVQTCNLIEGEFPANLCFGVVGRNPLKCVGLGEWEPVCIALAKNDVSQLTDSDEVTLFWMMKAVESNNTSVCNNISDPDDRDDCYFEVEQIISELGN